MIAFHAWVLIRHPQRGATKSPRRSALGAGALALPLNNPPRERYRREAIGDESGEQTRLEFGGERRELGLLTVRHVAPASMCPAHQHQEPTALVRVESLNVGPRDQRHLADHKQLGDRNPLQTGHRPGGLLDQ